MGKIEKAKADDLGVKVSGSARTGHKIELAQESACYREYRWHSADTPGRHRNMAYGE